MSSLLAIPRAAQRDEPWANGAGTTTVVLREPDSSNWRVRISVARVEQAGPFSELPDTRRSLVPLDAPMTLRFADGTETTIARMHAARFAGSPAPTGMLPEGPTRDFNLMLRGDARGDAFPRTLVNSMMLLPEPGVRWLVYLDSGRASLHGGAAAPLALDPGDAALVDAATSATRMRIEGGGELVLVKLYA